MIDQMTLQTIGILLTAITVSIAAIYYTLTLRYTKRNQEQALETRQAQMFMQIYIESHNDPSFIEAMQRIFQLEINTYEEYQKVWENEKDKQAIARVAWFFEGVGVLVKEGYVDIRLVALLMTGMIQGWWKRIYKSYIEEGREKINMKRWMSEAEYLYNELMKYIEEHPELKT